MRPRDLSLLVMHVSTRCDQTCAHCSIWRQGGKAGRELDGPAREAIIREAHSLGARAILFTGGEPLLCDHVERLARVSRDLGLSVQIATNGLGLARAADWLAGVAHEIYVSLDGPEALHDELRGTGMYARLVAAVGVLAAMPVRPRLVARSVISRRNAGALEQTVAAARFVGFDAVSFLPVDTTSDSFGGDPATRAVHALAAPEIEALRQGIGRLARRGVLGAYVVEDERKLLKIARFLDEARGEAVNAALAPRCNAPEWSSVIEADGSIRPCFFQPPSPAAASATLREVRRSAAYRESLRALGSGNRICASCVCPRHVAMGAAGVAERVGALLERVLPRSARREVSPT